MKLNEIKNKGNWSDIAGQLNTNFGKISTEVDALNNATKKNKGFYSSLQALESAHPTSSNGSIAYVKDGNQFKIYAYDAGWVETGMTYTENIELGDYYTQAEIDDIIGNWNDEPITVVIGDRYGEDENFNLWGQMRETKGRVSNAEENINRLGNQLIDYRDFASAGIDNNSKIITAVDQSLLDETQRAKDAEEFIGQQAEQNFKNFSELGIEESANIDGYEIALTKKTNTAEKTKVKVPVYDMLNPSATPVGLVDEIFVDDMKAEAKKMVDAIQKSVWGGEEKVVFDAYEVAVITPLMSTQTAAGGSIVYVKNPNTDKANVNGFFYKLNDSYYWDANINGVDVLLPFRDDERVLYPEKNYVCNGKTYYVDNNFLSLTIKSSIPVFEESTEEAIEEMIANGTWKEGVIYYTVEE